jgi:hypothetical protein
MIARIQTYFSYFFGKFISLVLLLFILTSFNLQILTATAQTTPPAGTATTPPKPTTNTGTTTNANVLTQKQVDDRIGTLKNCSVNSSNEGKLKDDPNAANTFILNCLKDIVQIVITISVILAIMRLIFVGIKFLNTFEDEGKLQGELAKAITGFVAGAVILGLFAAIINVVNPSALRIDKIFSAQVIADYKCLNKGISDPVATKVNEKNCLNNPQGSGPTKSNDVFTSENIKTVLESTKPEDKAKQDEIEAQIVKCNSLGSITVSSADEATRCQIFQQYKSENPNVLSSSSYLPLEPNMTGNRYANGTYSNITVSDKTITTEFSKTGSTKSKAIIFTYIENCEKSPLLTEKTITSGKLLNIEGCNMAISTNK